MRRLLITVLCGVFLIPYPPSTGWMSVKVGVFLKSPAESPELLVRLSTPFISAIGTH